MSAAPAPREINLKIFMALGVLFLIAGFFIGPTNDNNILLQYTIHMIDGPGRLYKDWAEFNPPLIMLLYTVPVIAARLLHVPTLFMLHVCTALLCLLSLGLVKALLKDDDRHMRYVWLAAAVFTLLIIPHIYDAAHDREHLFLIFSFPWITAKLRRQRPTVGMALMAGVGFCIKPFNMIVFILLAFTGTAKDRPFKKDIVSLPNWVIGGMALLYVAVIVIFFHPYFEMATLAHVTYAYLAVPPATKLLGVLIFTGLSVFAVMCVPCFSPDERPAFLGLCAGMAAVYMFSGGWNYSYYLLLSIGGFIAFLAIADYFYNPAAPKIAPLIAQIVSLLAVFLIFAIALVWTIQDINSTRRNGFPLNSHYMPPYFYNELRMAAGQTFVFLSTTTWASNIAGTDAPPLSVFAFDFLWPVPWLQAHSQAPQATFVRRELSRALIDALSRQPPPTLIIDERQYPRALPDDFKLRDFLSQDPGVKAAFSRYHLVKILNCCSAEEVNTHHFSDDRNVAPDSIHFSIWQGPGAADASQTPQK